MHASIFLSAGILLLGASCVDWGTSVGSVEPAALEVEDYETFSFLPGSVVPTDDSLNSAVRATVQHELIEKGYAPASHETADLALVYYTDLTAPLDAAGFAYSAEAWEESHAPELYPGVADRSGDIWDVGHIHDPHRYVGMALVVDAVDRRTSELVWRGWARTTREPEYITSDTIVDAVAVVMEQFPARQK